MSLRIYEIGILMISCNVFLNKFLKGEHRKDGGWWRQWWGKKGTRSSKERREKEGER